MTGPPTLRTETGDQVTSARWCKRRAGGVRTTESEASMNKRACLDEFWPEAEIPNLATDVLVGALSSAHLWGNWPVWVCACRCRPPWTVKSASGWAVTC